MQLAQRLGKHKPIIARGIPKGDATSGFSSVPSQSRFVIANLFLKAASESLFTFAFR